jgi:hypothetical protein
MFVIVGFLEHQILSIIRSQIETQKKFFSKHPCKFKEMFTIEQSKEIDLCEQKLAK